MSDINERYGFTDEAAEEDKFGITDYIGGLAKFVEQCNTPLTMSIQGSWGTGKTSIMNLVKNQLSDSSVPIWFNTWQFSQFNMDNQLAVSLLSSLISEFQLKDKKTVEQANKLVKGLRFVAGVGKDLALAYVDSKIGGRTADMIETATQKAADSIEDDFVDPTVAIRKLRDQFAKCVQQTLEEQNKKRIIIFIDDLDRLEPRKAVELLEVLKIFLDCKNCVFILAIDYDVVCRGVAAKYGSLADDPVEAAEKGKSFFDKIIQVPFKMPIARYDITGYVESCFSKIGVSFNSSEEIKVYEDLIKRSIGTNPRSMKRLFNSYQLLTIVVPSELLAATKNQQLLFAILCLQYCSEAIYNYLIRHAETLSVEIFNAIVDSKYEELIKLVEDVDDLTEDDLASAQPFMEKFREAVDSDGKNGIDNEELQNFIKVLSFSAITSATDTEPAGKRQAASVVTNVNDLKFAYTENKPSDVEKIMNALAEVIPDIPEPLMKNRKKNMAVEYRFSYSQMFGLTIYERKGGFSLEVSGATELIDNPPEYVVGFMKSRGLSGSNWYSKGKYFQFTIKNGNDSDIEEMKKVVKAFVDVLK